MYFEPSFLLSVHRRVQEHFAEFNGLESVPVNWRSVAESYSASSTAGSAKLEPLLQKINPQHLLQLFWPTSLARLQATTRKRAVDL
jgi:hypothetical protein